MHVPARDPVGAEGPGEAPGVLVACIGNSLVADDAFGPAVYDCLAAGALPAGVRVELLGVGGLSLLDALRGERILVVVDAVRFGAPPGTMHVLDWEDIPGAPGLPVTAHGIGVREAIEIGRLIGDGRVPDRVTLVGVEGRRFDGIGEPMAPEVAAAVLPAAREVVACARLLASRHAPLSTFRDGSRNLTRPSTERRPKVGDTFFRTRDANASRASSSGNPFSENR